MFFTACKFSKLRASVAAFLENSLRFVIPPRPLRLAQVYLSLTKNRKQFHRAAMSPISDGVVNTGCVDFVYSATYLIRLLDFHFRET